MGNQNFREEIISTSLELVKEGLIRLSAGNVSVRLADNKMAITPSSMKYSDVKPEDIVITDLEGNVIEGTRKPSSEKALHAEIYKARPDVNAVIHSHSIYAITLAVLNKAIPPICLEIAHLGGSIPVMEYILPGTKQVGEATAAYFQKQTDLKGLLMKNHGLVAVGKDLYEAFCNTYDIETGAQIYHLALQTGQEPESLSEEQLKEYYATYVKAKEQIK